MTTKLAVRLLRQNPPPSRLARQPDPLERIRLDQLRLNRPLQALPNRRHLRSDVARRDVPQPIVNQVRSHVRSRQAVVSVRKPLDRPVSFTR